MLLLPYGCESRDFNKTTVQFLDFSLICFGMKLFRTSNRQFIIDCFHYFRLDLPNTAILKRMQEFLAKFAYIDNTLCRYIAAFVH
jgi:hypothetical protein